MTLRTWIGSSTLALVVAALPFSRAVSAPPAGPTRVVMLADGSADGSGSPLRLMDYETMTCFVQGTGTLNAGNIYLEEADWDPQTASNYAGTWSIMSTTTAATVTGGAQLAVAQSSIRAYSYIRARRASVGGGGTVKVTCVAF